MISNNNIPLLVAGAGSIGERHISILQKLGYSNIYVYRQRNLPLRSIAAETVTVFTDWNEIKNIRPVAAFICTPTSQHLQQATDCAGSGIHLLVEKPLAADVSGFEALKKAIIDNNVYLQVAYMMRYHPLMQQMKVLIENKQLGNLLNFQTYWGEYLPDWHPWEDYRNSYAALKELGGGVALTLSHDIDLVTWLCNSKFNHFSTIKNYRSALEVNVESGADIGFQFANGITGHCHLNYFEKIPKRSYRFVFEEGMAEIDYYKTEMTVATRNETYIVREEAFERNNMFEEQCRFFMNKIESFNVKESLRQIEESEQIIKICAG
ncbi:MAG TPA: Gfo/Idh/MocA family oxidoreductase [Panacibacter sp.]|nr:Gfo/Idh/MocA family oxidoreductase [Panacibacter sp.]